MIVHGKPIAMHFPTKVDLQPYLPFTDVADTEITAPVRTVALNAKLSPNCRHLRISLTRHTHPSRLTVLLILTMPPR